MTKRATDAETALGEHRAQAEQSEILGALGLQPDDPRVAEVLPMLRWHHEQLQVEEGKERPSLTAHVKGMVEQGHYFVAGLKPAPVAPPAPPAKVAHLGAAKPPPRTVGATSSGTATPPTPEQVARMAPADLQAYLAGQDAQGVSVLDLLR